MNETPSRKVSRRDFLAQAGALAGLSALNPPDSFSAILPGVEAPTPSKKNHHCPRRYHLRARAPRASFRVQRRFSDGDLAKRGPAAKHLRRSRDWGRMAQYHPRADAPWTAARDGFFHLDAAYYAEGGGILLPSDHYETMFS